MRIALKAATAVLAGLVLLAQPETLNAYLTCNKMNPFVPNAKFLGVWKWATSQLPLVVCSVDINKLGQLVGGVNQCVGPAQWPTTGTLTGNIVISANCKVTGTLTLNVPPPGISQTYTVDAALNQTSNNSASIIMGALVQAGKQFYFWMIQSS